LLLLLLRRRLPRRRAGPEFAISEASQFQRFSGCAFAFAFFCPVILFLEILDVSFIEKAYDGLDMSGYNTPAEDEPTLFYPHPYPATPYPKNTQDPSFILE